MWVGYKMRYKILRGLVKVSGIDFGPKVTEIYRDGDCVIWRIAGHTGWSGQGSTRYYETEYYVLRVAGIKDEDGYEGAEVLRTAQPGRHWRQTLERLKHACAEFKSKEE